jgi:hypothetical protein
MRDSGQSNIPTIAEQRVHPSWAFEDLESCCCEAAVGQRDGFYICCGDDEWPGCGERCIVRMAGADA